jgi:hypothetical protein
MTSDRIYHIHTMSYDVIYGAIFIESYLSVCVYFIESCLTSYHISYHMTLYDCDIYIYIYIYI